MSIDSIGIHIWIFTIHWYGMILMLGVVGAVLTIDREAVRRDMDREVLQDGLLWVVLGGIIGARLWFVLTPPPSFVELGFTTQYYLTHPLDAINVPGGGLTIAGAVIGGGLTTFLFVRRRKQYFPQWADAIAPGVAIGQAIGRWGNFLNQEIYGFPTNLPWGIFIDPEHRLPGFENFERFHPLFLYESLLNLANAIFLLWFARRYKERLRDGDIFLIYLITYPIIRILMDFLRIDAALVGGVNINQALMAVVAIASAAMLYFRHRPEQNKALI